jgi:hypothetical protein
MQAVLLMKGILTIPTITASHSNTVITQYVLIFAKFNSLITLSIATRSCVLIFVVKYVIFNARTGSLNKLNE